MRKIILILLFTVFCSSFSFAEKNKLPKQSEMTSKKITSEFIYYAFIESYFKRQALYDNDENIINLGETVLVEQLKTSLKRQKKRRVAKCLYEPLNLNEDTRKQCAAKVIRNLLNKSEINKKRKPGDIFYVMDAVMDILPGDKPRRAFEIVRREKITTGTKCRFNWCPRYTDKFKKKLERFENDPSNEKVLGKDVVKYIENVKLLNRIEEKLGERNRMWTAPTFLNSSRKHTLEWRRENYDKEAIAALGGVNGNGSAAISNYSLLGDALNDLAGEVKKNKISPEVKKRRILLKKYSLILQNIKSKLEDENYKKIDQDIKKLSSIYNKLASLEKSSNKISTNFDAAIKIIFDTNNLIQKSISSKQSSYENKLFSLALINFMQSLTESIANILPEKYVVETKGLKKYLYNDYDLASIENFINQMGIQNKEKIKELKKENKKIDKYINTSDVIKRLGNISVKNIIDAEITITSVAKKAELQIINNLSAEVFKNARSVIDKLQKSELSDMSKELSEVASEVASDSSFQEATSDSVLDKQFGEVSLKQLIGAARNR
tara:strand:+ start:315 stop:1967 length:1653 start_codon:yes stop_codon:yes gene_type:complete